MPTLLLVEALLTSTILVLTALFFKARSCIMLCFVLARFLLMSWRSQSRLPRPRTRPLGEMPCVRTSRRWAASGAVCSAEPRVLSAAEARVCLGMESVVSDSEPLLQSAPVQAGPGRLALLQLWQESVYLLRDREFIKLTIGFSMGIGLFNALLTVVEQVSETLWRGDADDRSQIIQPSGYSSGDAALFGGILLGFGATGS